MIDNYNLPLNLRLIRNCPICQREYMAANVQVLSESEFGVLTYATCSVCGAHLLTKFSNLPQGVVGNAILTDLQAQEVLSFAEQLAVSGDDVLAAHQLLLNKELINEISKNN
ncbi:MAG: hypothetical protein WC465_01180 [Patescibacteria group bacterium]